MDKANRKQFKTVVLKIMRGPDIGENDYIPEFIAEFDGMEFSNLNSLDELLFWIWDYMGLPDRECKAELVISFKNPKPEILNIFNEVEENKFKVYEKVDEVYQSGEIILKEKVTHNGEPGLLIKCSALGIITDLLSLEKYFQEKRNKMKGINGLDPTGDTYA